MSGREIIWTPSPERAEASSMAAYMRWLETERGLSFAGYPELWEWSVSDLDAFWRSIWDYFSIGPAGDVGEVLAERRMPGAVWFPGVTLNFTEVVLRNGLKTPDKPALIIQSETFGSRELWLSLVMCWPVSIWFDGPIRRRSDCATASIAMAMRC